jgi:hypothetical protein
MEQTGFELQSSLQELPEDQRIIVLHVWGGVSRRSRRTGNFANTRRLDIDTDYQIARAVSGGSEGKWTSTINKFESYLRQFRASPDSSRYRIAEAQFG